MSFLFSNRWLYITLTTIVILLVVGMVLKIGERGEIEMVTTTVERGTVRQSVSVSGIAEADQTADLAFSVPGIVEKVMVRTGDYVEAGTILATLETSALQADRKEAQSSLDSALAERAKLLAGPTTQSRAVTAETVATSKLNYDNTQENETEKIRNAYRTLLSSDLEAIPKNANNDAVAPTVSGTYSCASEGEYKIEVYESKAPSGYSYRLSGLESGIYSVTTEHASLFGDCGLQIQFDTTSDYTNTNWTIQIPNSKATSYITNKNAYELTVTQAKNAIRSAEQALLLTTAEAEKQNSPTRSEDIDKANAVVAQARARLARVESTLSDRSIIAPFSGVITELDILPGETVSTAPVMTLLANSAFEVVARIPEIDIGKLFIDQPAELIFDARPQETLTGSIRFISLQATKIDGVAYYKAFITLSTTPSWMRSGLNTDIEIITAEEQNALRIPKRFLGDLNKNPTVTLLTNTNTLGTVPVEIILDGNDGFVAVTGINEGDIVVAP